ncbi:MAG: S8 family serine peptidase [Candidatus Omnitrophota bacterium]
MEGGKIGIKKLAGELERNPDIEYAEPNYIYRINSIPNDPFYHSSDSWGQGYDDLWGLKRINTEQAWDTTKGEGVIVAVIDTGIDYAQEDLSQNIWINSGEDINHNGIADASDFNNIDDDENGFVDDIRGYDFVSFDSGGRDNDPLDDHGHGTHCSGIIAAVENNSIGIVGVAPRAKVMAVKALNEEGAGIISDLADAIYYATNNGAHVLSNSWGGPFKSRLINEVFGYAYANGAVIVAAAGNDNSDVSGFSPANIPYIITVASFASDDTRSTFSNWGDLIDVTAPGGSSGSMGGTPSGEHFYVDILSLRAAGTDMYLGAPNYTPGEFIIADNYYRARGTSMACPHVSGIAALLLSYYSELTNFLIDYIIHQSAEDVLEPGKDIYSGYGLIDAAAALSASADIISENLAELLVMNVSVTSRPEDTIYINADIINAGLSTASNVTYKIFANEESNQILLLEDTLPSLSPKESFEIDVILSLAGLQPESISIYVDPDRNIDEYFETNNSFDVDVSIGWPQDTGGSLVTSSAAVVDLNNDGFLEVIVGTFGGQVFVWDAFGRILYGWPQTVSGSIHSSPNVVDLDNDGDFEIILGALSLGENLYAWNDDGTIVSGWPQSLDDFVFASPATADLDNDGMMEIVVSDLMGKVYVFHHDGSIMNGWPQDTENNGFVWSSPAIGDLNNDGTLEIILGGQDGRVYVWNPDGTLFNGWPKDTGGEIRSAVAIADLDHDGTSEVIVGTLNNHGLYVFHADGSIFEGWPNGDICAIGVASPSVADMDFDGIPEIVAGCSDGKVYAWYPGGEKVLGWPKTTCDDISPAISPSIFLPPLSQI